MKCKAVPKATNKPLDLFVLGFTMKGAAKDNELTAGKKKEREREKRVKTLEEFMQMLTRVILPPARTAQHCQTCLGKLQHWAKLGANLYISSI